MYARKHIIYDLYVCIVNTLYMACLICMHRCLITHYIWSCMLVYVCIVNTLYMACLICMHRKHIIYGLSYMYAS